MNSWIEILNKFIDKTPLFPAGALSAFTVIVLRKTGILTDLMAVDSWVWMFGIFCSWVTLVTWVNNAWTRGGITLMDRVGRWRNQAAEVEKLNILNEKQKNLLEYLKTKGMRQFQAY